MNMSSNILRENIEAMEDIELLRRWHAESFADHARVIAQEELARRGLDTRSDKLNSLIAEENGSMKAFKSKKRKAWAGNAVVIGGAVVGISLSKILGITLFIPAVLGFLSFFVIVKIDQRLRARNKFFGGLGVIFVEDFPFKGILAVELGHVLWGALGVSLYLSGFLDSSEIQISTYALIEAGIFLTLVIFYLIRPGWLSILFLIAYHCAAIYELNAAMNNLHEFSRPARDALERGYITHALFHGIALFGLVWFLCLLFAKERRLAETNTGL